MDLSYVHVGRVVLSLDMDVAFVAQGTAMNAIHRHIASVLAMLTNVDI